MNTKKIISCFIVTVLVIMTCTLCGCRKKDGDVGDGSDHKATASPSASGTAGVTESPTDNIGEDIKDDIEDDIIDPIESMMPDSSPKTRP